MVFRLVQAIKGKDIRTDAPRRAQYSPRKVADRRVLRVVATLAAVAIFSSGLSWSGAVASDNDDALAQELFAAAENREAEPQSLEAPAPADEEITEELPADSGEIAGEPALQELTDEEQPAEAEMPRPAGTVPEEEAGSSTGDETEDSRLDGSESQVESPAEDESTEMGAEAAPAELETADLGQPEQMLVSNEQGEELAEEGLEVAQALEMQPFAEGVEPPYVKWSVRDAQGTAVPGAEFQIDGRVTLGFFGGTSWPERNVVVEDCVGLPCAGPDLDPMPGEFAVKSFDSESVADDRRYRVRQFDAPAGYEFSSSSSWRQIAGRGWPNSDRATSGSWVDGVHDFGSFQVREIDELRFAPSCEVGYVYGLSDDGQMRQVAPGVTSATDFGSRASGVSSFNGLGIGSGGSPVFAYERSSNGNELGVSRAAIWRFDTATNTWASVGHSVNSNASSRSVQFVGGAVNLQTGRYTIGGFNSDGDRFRIWEYDPNTNTSVYKGEIDTSDHNRTGLKNGDIAFDANGNLFIVRGIGDWTTVFSVTAANFNAASGGLIPSSGSTEFSTMTDVNGVAFDSDGRAYLGSGSALRSYATPGWTDSQTRVSSRLNSTDLATCASPPTITLEKVIEGGRANVNDQFTISLASGTQTLGTATTTGTADGVQEDRVGPMPTVRGWTLTFSETGASNTSLSNYATTYRCLVDGSELPTPVFGQGTTGSVTIPMSGEEVVCQFTNRPLLAQVVATKTVVDRHGENPLPGVGWEFTNDFVVPAGGLVLTPPETTQTTDEDGQVSWIARFNNASDTGSVTVSEAQQDGFQFVSGQCEHWDISGNLEGSFDALDESGVTIPDVGPGDAIECAFTNMELMSSLTLIKELDINYDGDADENDFDLTATGADADPVAFLSGETKDVVPGTYTISETLLEGYEFVSMVCVDDSDSELDVTDMQVGVENAADVTCTLINRDLPGAAAWLKVDADDTTVLLPGSIWTLQGPRPDDVVTIEDCVEESADLCGGEDRDPLPGQFLLEGLSWGDYVLTETTAPAGYTASGEPIAFSITAGNSGTVTDIGSVENERIPGTVSWAKEDPNGERLAGSKWELTGPIVDGEESTSTEIEDCVAASTEECAGADKNPDAGGFLIEDLEWGDYTLVETSAPAGYVLDDTVHDFTISPEAGLDFVFEQPFENVPRQMPVLPLTGGLGRDFFIIAGLSVLTLGLGALMAVQYRRRREGVA